MLVYLLIHEQDTDAACGSDAQTFTDKKTAQDAMRDSWQSAVDAWKYNDKEHLYEDECECLEDTAVIRDGSDCEHWRIEEQMLDIQVAVRVEGGLVQAVYSNAGVSVDVYDVDVSDFPDEGEREEAEKRQLQLEELTKSPGWQRLW